MLVLPDTDRLRLDLDELGERVLEPPRDRHCSAEGHVEPRQLLRGVGGGGVDRGARLRHDGRGDLEVRVPLDEILGQAVGLSRRRAVADGDEVDVVVSAEAGEGGDRPVPLVLGHVRVDDVGGDDLARRVDHGDLDAGAEAWVETHRGAGAGGSGEEQVAQVRGEDADRLLLGRPAQPHSQVDPEVDEQLGAPGPPHGVAEPGVGRTAPVRDPEAGRDGPLVLRRPGLRPVRRREGVDGQAQDLLLLAPEHGEDAVGRHLRERLGEVEVVGELRTLGLLPRADLGGEVPARPHPLAQDADEVRVLGEAFDEDGPGPLEGGGGVGHPLRRVDEGGRRGHR